METEKKEKTEREHSEDIDKEDVTMKVNNIGNK